MREPEAKEVGVRIRGGAEVKIGTFGASCG